MPPDTHSFRGYEVPVTLLNMTGATPASFDDSSNWDIEHIRLHVGIRPTDSVVEIGSGIGRLAIPLTTMLDSSGRYVGLDIIRPSIEWCASAITPRHPNFRFVHVDVADQLHNPGGTLPITACKIPAPSNSVDLIILNSVFTHMLEPGVVFYMREFARILKPTGLVYATCFIVDDAILKKLHGASVTAFSLTFEHPEGDGCYINRRDFPLAAVAFTQPKLADMVRKGRLEFDRPIKRGAWSGTIPDTNVDQDIVVLKRRPRLAEKLRRLVGNTP